MHEMQRNTPENGDARVDLGYEIYRASSPNSICIPDGGSLVVISRSTGTGGCLDDIDTSFCTYDN
jgi:hypothetical protein